ncbi:hypothetical protein [Spirosoma sp. KNUC1025]|uniref:hypothetical protein n=1 Tax=Spirosoma sp. KNUC1025 TaxID=2894082 RepID=UPI003866EE5A|nr:hypothetical protein LN737_20895 [Spirosoma sp. KNUC1025]
MSAKNFYQTFYQADPIFRLADDVWMSAEQPVESLSVIVDDTVVDPLAAPSFDLLRELDVLAAQPMAKSVTSIQPDLNVAVSIETLSEPALQKLTPEPLPEPPPRPTVPSILPPVQQQPRLPQLNHKVLLLADEALDPSNLLFLEKILKAVNLNVNGVDLLNLHGVRDVNFAELLRGKYIHHFITFGVPFERIDLDIMMDRYAPVRFEGITFLMADSLPTIEADQNLKRRLWGALQRMFLR